MSSIPIYMDIDDKTFCDTQYASRRNTVLLLASAQYSLSIGMVPSSYWVCYREFHVTYVFSQALLFVILILLNFHLKLYCEIARIYSPFRMDKRNNCGDRHIQDCVWFGNVVKLCILSSCILYETLLEILWIIQVWSPTKNSKPYCSCCVI